MGPAEEAFYYELHVTPSNSILQLRFDGEETRRPLDERMVSTPVFSSHTWVTPEGWSVFARIPLPPLSPQPCGEWRLSFGRYDYTPPEPNPVISSTSPHTVCNFHRKEEWRWVTFAELPSVAVT